MSITLKIGDKAPDFELKNANGRIVKLSDFAGRKVIIYFYPKDNTPGCTAEACSIRDNFSEIKKKAIVLGISMDNEISHKKFAEKYSLPFELLCDAKGEVSKAYGVKGFLGIKRTTFAIDKKGYIENILTEIDNKRHGEQILEAVK